MKQERIEELLAGTDYLKPHNCECAAHCASECGCDEGNWYSLSEIELAARVQLLAKALQEARVEVLYWFENADPAIPLQDRAPAGWVRVVDKIDAALAEAGITEES